MSKMYGCFNSQYKKLASSFLLFAFVLQSCNVNNFHGNGMRNAIDASKNDELREQDVNIHEETIVENGLNHTQMTDLNLSSDTNREGIFKNSLKVTEKSKYDLKHLIAVGVISGLVCIGITAGGAIAINSAQKSSSQSSSTVSGQVSSGGGVLVGAAVDSLTCSCNSLSTCRTNLATSTASLSTITSRFNNCTSSLTNSGLSSLALANNLTNCKNELNGYQPSSTYFAGCLDRLNGNTTAGITGYISQFNATMTQLWGDGSLALPGVYNLLNGNTTLSGGVLTGYISQWSTLMNSYFGNGTFANPGCYNYLNGNSTLAGGVVTGYISQYDTCNLALNGNGTWSNPGYYGRVNGYTIGGQAIDGYVTNYTTCDTALHGNNGNNGCLSNYQTYFDLFNSKTSAFDSLTASLGNLAATSAACNAAWTANNNTLYGYNGIPGLIANFTSCNNDLNGYQVTGSPYIAGCKDHLYGNVTAGITGTSAFYGQLSGSTYTPGCVDALNGYYSTHVSPTQQYGCLSTLNGNSSTTGGLSGITGYISQTSALGLALYGDGTFADPGCNNSLYGNDTLIGGNITGKITEVNALNHLLYSSLDSNGNTVLGCMEKMDGYYTNNGSTYIPGCDALLNGNSGESVPSYLGHLDDMCLAYTLNGTTIPFCTTVYGGACNACTGTCSTTSNVTSCTSCTECTVSSAVSTATGTNCTECTLDNLSTDSGSCNTCVSYLLT